MWQSKSFSNWPTLLSHRDFPKLAEIIWTTVSIFFLFLHRANQSTALDFEAVHVASNQEGRRKRAYRQSGGATLLPTDPPAEVALPRIEAENPDRGTFAEPGWEREGGGCGSFCLEQQQQFWRQRHRIELNELGHAVPKGEKKSQFPVCFKKSLCPS